MLGELIIAHCDHLIRRFTNKIHHAIVTFNIYNNFKLMESIKKFSDAITNKRCANTLVLTLKEIGESALVIHLSVSSSASSSMIVVSHTKRLYEECEEYHQHKKSRNETIEVKEPETETDSTIDDPHFLHQCLECYLAMSFSYSCYHGLYCDI
jgi:hypothetical protein